MPKNRKIILVMLVTLELLTMYLMYKSSHNKKIVLDQVELKEQIGRNSFALFLDGEKYDGDVFPTNATLNMTQTTCINEFGDKIENLDITYTNGLLTIKNKETTYCTLFFDLFENKEYDFTGNYQVFIAPKNGNYQIELWGASGGYLGGAGAYTKGTIKLEKFEKLYIYVGEYPEYVTDSCYDYNPNSSFNGSLIGSCIGGGGATDIRLKSGSWDNFEGLKSRIMVAAGGGGGLNIYGGNGGYGGALTGGNATGNYVQDLTSGPGKGATQKEYIFGKSGVGTCISGNGYYSGEAGHGANAGGGSSYISGHPGCVAIKESSTEKNVQPKDGCDVNSPNLECSYHYSNKVFKNTEMKAGNETMPTHDGDGMMEGNIGNGYAKITFVN